MFGISTMIVVGLLALSLVGCGQTVNITGPDCHAKAGASGGGGGAGSSGESGGQGGAGAPGAGSAEAGCTGGKVSQE